LLERLGRWPQADEQYRKALAIHEKLAADFPAVPEFEVELGGSYCNFGGLVRDRGRASESLDSFDRAIRTLTTVYEQDRRLALARRYLRNSHFGRAKAYDRLQKHALALNDWDRAIELSPDEEKSTFRAGRAACRVCAGQTSEGVADAAELTTSQNWNAGEWYSFARVYAVASTKATDKKQAYGDRAMELLIQAAKAGFSDTAKFEQDTDLDSLRDRDDFKSLLAEMTSRIKAVPKP
jgi:tetratricopeptide (TPR) repeat protein